MGHLDINLCRQDFNGASNGAVLYHAYTNRAIIQSYLEGKTYQTSVTVRYPDEPERPMQHFAEANFSNPRFIHAFDEYLIQDCISILEIAPEKNIVAEVNKQFAGVMHMIERGYLPVRRSFYKFGASQPLQSANTNYNPSAGLGALITLADFRHLDI